MLTSEEKKQIKKYLFEDDEVKSEKSDSFSDVAGFSDPDLGIHKNTKIWDFGELADSDYESDENQITLTYPLFLPPVLEGFHNDQVYNPLHVEFIMGNFDGEELTESEDEPNPQDDMEYEGDDESMKPRVKRRRV